jgi:alpha-N-acetylglucosaminidase
VLFFSQLDKSLSAGTEFDGKAFDKQVKDWEWQWVNKHDNAYPNATSGNAVDLSKQLFEKYNSIIQQAYNQQ